VEADEIDSNITFGGEMTVKLMFFDRRLVFACFAAREYLCLMCDLLYGVGMHLFVQKMLVKSPDREFILTGFSTAMRRAAKLPIERWQCSDLGILTSCRSYYEAQRGEVIDNSKEATN
jgi:hypothetical protein